MLTPPIKGFHQLQREFSSQSSRGLPLCLGPAGKSFQDVVLYWGFG